MKEQKNLTPNKYLQPFQYKQWKIMGHLIEFNDSTALEKKERGTITFWKRYAKRTTGLFGLFVLIGLALAAFVIPYFSTNPRDTNVNIKYFPPGKDGHIFGTDQLGRDFWSYVWNGLRFSLTLGLFAAAVDFLVGATLGLLMGHYRKFDIVMQYIIKVLINIPGIMILILATLVFKPTFWTIAIGLTMTGWVGMALQIRAQVMRVKNFQWVTASKFLGTPSRKILINYLPVVIPLIITQIVLTVSGTILAETSISFIGLGVPNQPSLGSAITIGSQIILTFPRYTLIPSSILVMLTLSMQLMTTEIERALVRTR